MSSGIEIPAWAVFLCGVIIFPWLIWLTHGQFEAKKDIAINTTNDAHVGKMIESLKDEISAKITKLETDLKETMTNFKTDIRDLVRSIRDDR